MSAQHTIAFVTDELKASHAAAIACAVAEGVDTVEIRTIDGANFMSLSAAQQKAAAGELRAAGLKVAGLATPLLKWGGPGQPVAALGDQFGFDRAGRGLEELAVLAADAADIFGTRNLRIFSYLTYPGFKLDDLKPACDTLLRLAESRDLTLHVENEPVCNIMRGSDLLALMQAYRHPRLRALLDIGNIYHTGVPPTVGELTAVMPYVQHCHFKDYHHASKRYVALGEGSIPYGVFVPACLAAAGGRPLTLSVETHVPDDQPDATRRSLRALRRLVAASA